jgi:hypothetical protein
LGDVTGSIFDANIRRFLGTRGAVNSDILRTCADTATSHQFWFLNNGITVICDSFDPVTDPDNPHVKVKNMQIVNGCQTASALAIAEKDGKLAADARVLLRIYEAADSQLVDKIVLTTNNQNKISSRDLRSNDKIQVDMQGGFSKYNFYYERKVSQYGPNVPIDRIVVNEIVAQSYLAVVLKKPSDARRRKYKVWGELYDRIFSGQVIEPYVLAMLVFRATEAWLSDSGLTTDPDDVKRKIANNGSFHVARIASFIWRQSDNWSIPLADLQKQIALLGGKPNLLDSPLINAFEMLVKLIKATPHYASDLDTTLKSAGLETEIDKELHQTLVVPPLEIS